MMSAIDPHHRFLRRMVLQVGACWLLVLLAAVWAWRLPVQAAPVFAPARSATAVTATTAASAVDPATWNINVWRPFLDEAAPAAAAGTPLALRLFSIMHSSDGLTAAIAPGDNSGLLYLKAGDTGNGFTVVRVEANGVVLRINGQEQRLGLGP